MSAITSRDVVAFLLGVITGLCVAALIVWVQS